MRIKLILTTLLVVFFLSLPHVSFAQTSAIPCPSGVCDTALGPIDANDTAGIIRIIFTYVVQIAGTGAVILLLIGGYRIIMSRGDKERLQNAKDTITSAILGLVFIVLSLIILQIIGVDILQIPGFERGK